MEPMSSIMSRPTMNKKIFSKSKETINKRQITTKTPASKSASLLTINSINPSSTDTLNTANPPRAMWPKLATLANTRPKTSNTTTEALRRNTRWTLILRSSLIFKDWKESTDCTINCLIVNWALFWFILFVFLMVFFIYFIMKMDFVSFFWNFSSSSQVKSFCCGLGFLWFNFWILPCFLVFPIPSSLSSKG